MLQFLIGQQDSLPGGQRVHGELIHGTQRAGDIVRVGCRLADLEAVHRHDGGGGHLRLAQRVVKDAGQRQQAEHQEYRGHG